MSFFSACLNSLLTLERKTQGELAEACDVERTAISRMIKSGKVPTRVQLAKICGKISEDRARRAELLVAHLRDEAEAAHVQARLDARDYVLKVGDDMSDNRLVVPPHMVADIALLIDEAAKHEDFAELLADYASVIMRHRAEVLDAQRGAAGLPALPSGEVLPMVAESAESALASIAKIDGTEYPTRKATKKEPKL